MKFRVPTLEKDFDQFLDTANVPNQVVTVKIYHDWYNQEQFEEHRVEIYPDSTMSRYENSDSVANMRFKKSALSVDKGDMVLDPNGMLYVLDWKVLPESNNRRTRGRKCNHLLTITRRIPEVVDQYGMLVTEEHDETVVNQMPCNTYLYQGRPDYSASANTPGTTNSDILVTTIQFNDTTDNIRVGDEYIYGYQKYRIVDIQYVGVDLDGKGVMTLQSKVVAGGDI